MCNRVCNNVILTLLLIIPIISITNGHLTADNVTLLSSNEYAIFVMLNDARINFLNELKELTHCYRTGITNKVICLKNHKYEITTETFTIQHTEDYGLSTVYYGTNYGTHIDHSSLLIVMPSPVLLHVDDFGGNANLVVKDFNAGLDVATFPLPSDCVRPYELKHLYQHNVLLKCSGGSVYLFSGDTSEFAKLPVKGEECANSLSSVMITSQGTVILNKTLSTSIMLIPPYKIGTTSFQLNAISSFTCHWNGTVTNLYYTVSQHDGTVYCMSIPLESAANSSAVTEPHMIVKFDHKPFDSIESSIIGSVWVINSYISKHYLQDTVLININKEMSHVHISDGKVHVLHSRSTRDDQEGFRSSDLHQPGRWYLIIINLVVAVVLLIVVIFFTVGIILYRMHKRYINNSLSAIETRMPNYGEVRQREHNSYNTNIRTGSTYSRIDGSLYHRKKFTAEGYDAEGRLEPKKYSRPVLETDQLLANELTNSQSDLNGETNTIAEDANPRQFQCNTLLAVSGAPIGCTIHDAGQRHYQSPQDDNQPTNDRSGYQSAANDQSYNQSLANDQSDNQSFNDQGGNQNAVNEQGYNQSLANGQSNNQSPKDQGENSPHEPNDDHNSASDEDSSVETGSASSQSSDEGTDTSSLVFIHRPRPPFGEILMVIPREDSPDHERSDDETEISSCNNY